MAPSLPGNLMAPAGHTTVLLEEAVAALNPRQGGHYIDATFGGGGHAQRLLASDPPMGHLLAIDADATAVARARDLAISPAGEGRMTPIHANFGELATVAAEYGIAEVDGILFDLGLSSMQLDQPARGFAFRHEGPLDMRFDASRGQSASDIVNELPEEGLRRILWDYGEEPKARQVVRAIGRARAQEPIGTTGQLAAIIERAVGGRRGRSIHPATRTFQALRIAVNRELEMLEMALEAALTLLSPGARLVVISFHSLEDRIVKQFIERERAECICPPEQPVCTCNKIARLRRVGKPVKPSDEEIRENPRSRSAIMRTAERTEAQ